MQPTIQFDLDLIKRYDQSGPRYTSYPTAVSFHNGFDEAAYKQTAIESNSDPIPGPLSLYFHIPFCDTICFYCGCNKIATKDVSKFSAYLSRLYKEIEMQAALFDSDRVVKQLHWGGGTPTMLNAAEMTELMSETRKHFNLLDDGTGEYSIEIDPRSVNKESVKLMSELGFSRYSLGIQDVDPAVQRAVNRIQPQVQNQLVMDACRQYGARSISVDLIYGLPLQTTSGFEKTLETVIDMSPDRLSVFNYAHLPHMFKPQRRINAEDLPSPEVKLEILQMTIEKLVSAGYVHIGYDHFAKPDDELAIAQQNGTLHRNFQGYATHGDCDLIGMGVSSIGKVNNSYNQNVKTLEEYYEKIDAGHLATVKGIALDEDDQLRREVIQQLTCDFEIFFNRTERAFQINFQQYFARELEMLAPMAADGLIELGEDFIRVQPRGHLLVRNICMVFDVSLRKQDKEQRFSRVI